MPPSAPATCGVAAYPSLVGYVRNALLAGLTVGVVAVALLFLSGGTPTFHLLNPRDVVPESNMPGYPWLARAPANAADIEAKLRALRAIGAPYGDKEIAEARAELLAQVDAALARTSHSPSHR